MQISHQLVPKLKNLRLSGILATHEVRTQQAIEEKLSYVEFLQRLLEDKVERRAQKQLDLRLRRASFDLEKTLEGFDFSFNPSINRQQIFDLATSRFVERHGSVLAPYGRNWTMSSRLSLRPRGRRVSDGVRAAIRLDGGALPQVPPQWSTAKRFSSWSGRRHVCFIVFSIPR